MSEGPEAPLADEPAGSGASRPWAGLRAAGVCLVSAVIGFSALAATARFLSSRTDRAAGATVDAAPSDGTADNRGAAELNAGPAVEREPGASAEQFAAAIAVGDQLLLEGNAAAAWREYEWAFRHGELEGRPDVHFRMGLSSEHLGDFDRALSEYRLAASAARDDAGRISARMGQARIWVGLGKQAEARRLLSELWLTSGEWDESTALARECIYTLADACVRDCVRDSDAAWSDRGLLLSAWDAGDVTTWLALSHPGETVELPAVPPGVHVAQKSLQEPEGVFLRLNLTRLPLETAIASICEQAGFEAVWTPTARQAVLGRTVEPTLRMANLGVCLDLLTAGTGLSWTSSDGQIQFSGAAELSVDELQRRNRHAAARLVTHAILQYADSKLSPIGYLALGNLTMLDDRPAEAAAYYQQLLRQFPRSSVKIEAWFNLAKAQLAAGQRDQALDAFYHVVDSGSGHPVEAAAYLYIGRLLLDGEDARRASTAFMRATVLARDRDVRAMSVLGLSSAFLLSENPSGADLVLMEHRTVLEHTRYHNLAAYLGAAARHRAAQQDGLRAREARNLLAALAEVSPEDFFGSHGWRLLSSSFDELGLDDRAAELRADAMQQSARPAFHAEMAFTQAEWLMTRARTAEGTELLKNLSETADSEWAARARVRLYETYILSGEPQLAIQHCRERLADSDNDAEKRELLRVMGSAYQRAGEPAAAAVCFAGRDPLSQIPQPDGGGNE